jgi:membrane protease YdiL (CAAX protease family)
MRAGQEKGKRAPHRNSGKLLATLATSATLIRYAKGQPPDPLLNPKTQIAIVYTLGVCAYLFNGVWNAYLQDRTALYYSLDVAIRLVFPALSLVMLGRSGVSLENLGLGGTFSVQSLRATMLAVATLTIPYLLVCANIPFSDPILESYPATPSTHVGFLLYSVYLALSASFPEELLFRSIGFLCFRRSLFLLSSCVLFAFSHWEGGVTLVLTTAIFGLGAGLFYIKERRIVPVIVAHFLTDLSIVYILPLLRAAAGPSHN